MIACTIDTISHAARRVTLKAGHRSRTLVSTTTLGLLSQRRRKALQASGQIMMGRHSYFVPDVIAFQGETNKVVIGSFCSIDADTRIFVGGNHRTDWISTYAFRVTFGLPGAYEDGHPSSSGDVIIGHDVWIASGATVLSGVRIGNGAVVGTSAVVARDVAPYAIVVGNPAREIRKRFSDEHIAMLEELAWWNWPLQRILHNVQLLSSNDVDALYEAQQSNMP